MLGSDEYIERKAREDLGYAKATKQYLLSKIKERMIPFFMPDISDVVAEK